MPSSATMMYGDDMKRTQWLTRADAAARVGVSVRTIARMLAEGRLTRYYAGRGRNVRIDAAELDRTMSPDQERKAS